MAKSVYDIIKRQNGETFAQSIRRYDSGIFEIPNLPTIVRYAGRDADPILTYLESLKFQGETPVKIDKTPFELLEEAGYNAFYVDTLEKQKSIQKYFAHGEELCTFNDPTRYQNYHIIYAVKKNVDEINRADFSHPKREDAYATSVISIQMLKQGSFIKITNRYNHQVRYPDNTFNSNPDNIIKGLSNALKEYYHVDFSGKSVAMGYGFILLGNQIFKINLESENVYFGDDFYIKDGIITELNKDYEIIIDNVILNLKEGICYSPIFRTPALVSLLNEEFSGAKISIKKTGTQKSIYANNQEIVLLRAGELVALFSKKATKISNMLFNSHLTIEEVVLENVSQMGSSCFNFCPKLKSLEAPKLRKMGAGCVSDNLEQTHFFAPELESLEPDCLCDIGVKELYLANVKITKGRTICYLNNLETLVMPNLCEAHLICNKCRNLNDVEMPNLKKIMGISFTNLLRIKSLSFPCLESVFSSFIELPSLSYLNIPNLKKITGKESSFSKLGIREISFLKLKEIDGNAFNQNRLLEKVYFPLLEKIGPSVLKDNPLLKVVYLPHLKKLTIDTFKNSDNIQLLSLNKLEEISPYFNFDSLLKATKVYAPNLKIDALELMIEHLKKQGISLNEAQKQVSLFLAEIKLLPIAKKTNKILYNRHKLLEYVLKDVAQNKR